MANQKAHVVKRNDTFFVLPPMVDLSPGDKWKVVNHTAEDLWLTISPLLIDDGSPNPVSISQSIASGRNSLLKIHNNAPLGAYEYQIIMLKSGTKAKGNSDPMVIIDM